MPGDQMTQSRDIQAVLHLLLRPKREPRRVHSTMSANPCMAPTQARGMCWANSRRIVEFSRGDWQPLEVSPWKVLHEQSNYLPSNSRQNPAGATVAWTQTQRAPVAWKSQCLVLAQGHHAKLAVIYAVTTWMQTHSIAWAPRGGGHVPAHKEIMPLMN